MSRFTKAKKSVEPMPLPNPINLEFGHNIPMKKINGTSRHQLFETMGKTKIQPQNLLINDS